MSSVHYLRDLISQRLTAAAQEIFTEFEKITVRYEEEIDRQRKLLETSETLQMCMPQIKLQRIDSAQQHVLKEDEEVPADQEMCNQEGSSILDQEEAAPPQKKEELEELCTFQQGQQLVLKQEADTIMVTPFDEESDHGKPDSTDEQLCPPDSSLAESQFQMGGKHVDSGSIMNSELKTKTKHGSVPSNSNNVEHSSVSNSHCDSDTGVKCGVYGKTFKKTVQKKNHYKIITSEMVHSCKICGKSFSHSCNLSIHMKTHIDEGPYVCEKCGKIFKRKANLLHHMKIHIGEKKLYFCKICGKGFTHNAALTCHITVHTGYKPHSCKICGKSFSLSCNLSAHMKSHTSEGPYVCEKCGKVFKRKTNLLRHMKIHIGEKLYLCEINMQ
ncbi:uncharacterized protein PAE49_017090 [Odontesthes bonariensis]|uniref:uncharacterized protein LOC142399912 n=1 Tax=Odontesthes bonariensis TaxID=219752 RepID=UPI003F58C228